MHNAGHDLWLRMSHDQKDYILDNRDAKKNSVYSTDQAPNMYLAISEYCTKKKTIQCNIYTNLSTQRWWYLFFYADSFK